MLAADFCVLAGVVTVLVGAVMIAVGVRKLGLEAASGRARPAREGFAWPREAGAAR